MAPNASMSELQNSPVRRVIKGASAVIAWRPAVMVLGAGRTGSASRVPPAWRTASAKPRRRAWARVSAAANAAKCRMPLAKK